MICVYCICPELVVRRGPFNRQLVECMGPANSLDGLPSVLAGPFTYSITYLCSTCKYTAEVQNLK